MNPTAAGAQPLRYFIHDDFDALRMEISGGLVGPGAQKAFEDWRSARSLVRRARRVVDISYVTEADEDGKAVLRAWQEQEAQIVASTPASRAIANSILQTPVHLLSARLTLVGRLGSFFSRVTAGNLARAENASIPSADPKQQNVESAEFPLLCGMERHLR
jgi:hypothetical protein